MVTHLEDVSVELFADYGIPTELGEDTSPPAFDSGDGSTLAVIGFVGQGLRGALLLVALDSAIAAWLETMGQAEGDAADVLGEFSNMLLGRLKTRLLPEGIALSVSTPTTASGNKLRVSGPSAHAHWLSLEGRNWNARVRLETTFDPDFTHQVTDNHDAPAEAGAAIFF
jgi:CheY-specific phosphatase CheX